MFQCGIRSISPAYDLKVEWDKQNYRAVIVETVITNQDYLIPMNSVFLFAVITLAFFTVNLSFAQLGVDNPTDKKALQDDRTQQSVNPKDI